MNDVVFKFIITYHLSLISCKPLVTNYLGLFTSKPQLEVPLGQQGGRQKEEGNCGRIVKQKRKIFSLKVFK